MSDGSSEPQLETETTPVPEPAWRTLHHSSVVVGQRLGLAFTALIASVSLVSVLIAVFAAQAPGWVKILVALGWLGIAGFFAWLSWTMPLRRFRYTRYRVDALGLLIHRGRMFHSELAVARSRIQHTDVTQGPVQRLYELATLTIHTAGTEDAQIQLTGVALDEARRLRAELTSASSDDVV